MRVFMVAIFSIMVWGIAPLRADDGVRGLVRTALPPTVEASSVEPSVARAPTGETLIAWVESPGVFGSRIQYLVLDRSGAVVGNGPRTLDTRFLPGPLFRTVEVAGGPSGFLVGFDVGQTPWAGTGSSGFADWNILVVLIDLQGNEVVRHEPVEPRWGFDEVDYAVTSAADGTWAVAWVAEDVNAVHPGTGDAVTHGVFTIRYSNNLDVIDPMPVRADIAAWSLQRQGGVDVATAGDRVIVTWHDGEAGAAPSWTNSPDGHGQGVLMRVLAPSVAGLLTPVSTEILVNGTGANDQRDARVAAADNGRVTVAWEGGSTAGDDVFAARFDSAGNRTLTGDVRLTQATGWVRLTDLTAAANGEPTAIYTERRSLPGGSQDQARFVRLDVRLQVIQRDHLVGSGGAAAEEFIAGSASADAFGNLMMAWRVSPVGASPATGGVSFRSLTRNMLDVTPRSVSPGGSATFTLDSPSDPSRPYWLVVAAGRGEIPIDSRWVPLSDDALLGLSVSPMGLPASLLPGARGTLDGTGRASGGSAPILHVPNDSSLINVTVSFVFITLDPMAPSGIATISTVRDLWIF